MLFQKMKLTVGSFFFHKFYLIICVLGSFCTLEPAKAGGLEIHDRLLDPSLKSAIMGGLLFLDDSQIRQREGRGDPRFDACSGDGCRQIFPQHPGIPFSYPAMQNRNGEWASFIHIFPAGRAPWQPPGEALLQIQDSNLFMTVTTLYPLFLIDESELAPENQIVREIRQRAIQGILSYRRGDGFSFWPQLPGSSSSQPRVGPLNIPMVLGHGQYLSTLLPGSAMRSNNPRFMEWSKDLFNPSLNANGVDALANIPNDADDTALAFISLHQNEVFDDGIAAPREVLDTILKWRDAGRDLEDGRDQWKTRGSDGFLTWLKDENLSREERFSSPASGVIPLGVNNVDCVVNANALASFGFAGRAADPAVFEVSELLLRAAEMRAWPECGLYYPQRMMFPYALSRAYRDAGVRNPALDQAMRRILFDILRDQKETGAAAKNRMGAMSGGADVTYDLSTALALTSLLNIGETIAKDAQIEGEYHDAITQAVAYLLKSQQSIKIRFSDTFNREYNYPNFPSRKDDAATWESGLFFSASKWSLAQWRSQAYTTSMVLEALIKYALHYDKDDELTFSRRLKIGRYARSASEAPVDFKVRS